MRKGTPEAFATGMSNREDFAEKGWNIMSSGTLYVKNLSHSRKTRHDTTRDSGEVTKRKHKCTCTDTGLDRQCKLTGVTVETIPLEVQNKPTRILRNRTIPYHVGLEFITNDLDGTGTLLIVKDSNKSTQLKIELQSGKLFVSFTLPGSTKALNLSQYPSMSDSEWHWIDVFLMPNGLNAITIKVLADRCYSDSTQDVCSNQTDVSTATSELDFGAFVQVGSTGHILSGNYGWCVKQVTIGGELIDFYDATRGQISRRGCPKSTMGCKSANEDVCGTHASCRNKIGNTPMYICRCHPGYEPDTNSGSNPVYWKCNNPSKGWQLTGNAYYGRFIDKLPRGLRISFRTRTQTFKAFAVDAWNLMLRVSNGVPELLFGSDSIQLGSLNVSDGNWHLVDMTFTRNFMDLRVDELDREFYNSTYFAKKTIQPIAVDTVIAGDTRNSTCIDDAWIDFDDTWPDYQRDYPLVNLTNPPYVRHLEWSVTGRQLSCDGGQNQCAAGKNPCGANETCATEWRGYRCDCVNGTTRTSQGTCVSVHCWPNPCVNGDCSESRSQTGPDFICTCRAGYTGDLCDRAVDVASAGLTWWAILLIVLLILLIIIIIIIIVCCNKRRRRAKKTGSNDVYPVLSESKLESESQFNDPWGPTEKNFTEPVDYGGFQGRPVKRRPILSPVDLVRMNGGPQDLHSVAPAAPSLRAPRDYGQKTSSVPPWEKLEAQNSAAMNLDQVLEYGYEGYDGKPPPEFCVSEPISIANGEDDEESELDRPNGVVLTGEKSRGRSMR
ncbi:unnamed protein product [Calicophoron daubneyi]|uniref:Uncharacterized protein n=1 Tax=Calicophoron daubneyi TaxID=300641 RepID=A0AAV2TRJ7_CALDB